MSRTAIVLAGHGSHISPHTAGIIWAYVDRLRALHLADEVTAAFWKEAPSFYNVLSTLSATDITIVPMFTAQGYFTKTVIPTEMGLAGAVTEREGRLIRYTRTLGEHPRIGEIIQQRVEQALASCGSPLDEVAVALIGHSTRRNPESRQATETQAQQIRQRFPVKEVQAVYLDDSPEIPEIYHLTTAPTLIAVPYFLAMGSHTTIDVPTELGLASGQSQGQIQGRKVFYTPPIGTDGTLLEVILDLIRAAGMPMREAQPGSKWDCFPQIANPPFATTLGQLKINDHSIHHQADHHPGKLLSTVSEIRAEVRENPFRPLATSRDLPQGWRVEFDTLSQGFKVIETIYPGVLDDWHKNLKEQFKATPLEDTLARQTGMFRQLQGLDATKQAELVEQVCGHCVRQPTWYHGTTPPGEIPCREACNFWLSAALEATDDPR